MNNAGLDKIASDLEAIQRAMLKEAAAVLGQKGIETYQSIAKNIANAIYWVEDAKKFNQ